MKKLISMIAVMLLIMSVVVVASEDVKELDIGFYKNAGKSYSMKRIIVDNDDIAKVILEHVGTDIKYEFDRVCIFFINILL